MSRVAPTLVRPASLARLAVLLFATLVPSYALAGGIVHVVAKGQTLGRIAKRYGTTVDALRAANSLERGERIRPGLELVIPEKGKEHDAKGGAAAATGGRAAARETRAGNFAARPKRPGFVHMVRGGDHLETQLLTRHGRLVPSALQGVDRMLRFDPTSTTTAAGAPPTKAPPVDPRLATLIGMVSDHFGGRTLHVVSGFRPWMATQHTKNSNHNVGRAVDFSIDGVPNTALRDFCRTFRNAGVGYYPNSTFVHLDVRGIKTYWIDYSAPGETPRYDSPSSQSEADESAGEVDVGGIGGAGGAPSHDSGSGGTH